MKKLFTIIVACLFCGILTTSVGSVAKDYSPQAENYGSGKVIHTGPRGGQYYINDKGNKIYIPKQKSKTNSSSKSQTNTLYYPW